MRIYYCGKCETRLTEEDLEAGKAVLDANGGAFCFGCAPVSALSPSASSKKSPTARNEIISRAARKTPVRTATLPHETIFTGGSTHRATHTAPHAIPMPGALPNPSKIPLKWAILGGAIPLLAMAAALYALGIFGGKPASKTVGQQESTVATSASGTATFGSGTILTPSTGPNAGLAAAHSETGERADAPLPGIVGEMVKERRRDAAPEQQRAAAERQLAEAREFYRKFPQDPWAYADMLQQIPKNTPASDEARRIIADLHLSAEKSGTPAWYRDWNFPSYGAKAVARYDFDGRNNVLQTIPPGRDSELHFLHSLAIPAGRLHLSFSARTEELAGCKIALEIDGRQQLLEDLTSAAWRTFDIDLSAFKGTEVDVQIRQISSVSASPSAFWTQPIFRETPESSAKLVAYNPQALAYAKPKPPAGTTKRASLAPPAWKESPDWKKSLDLLTLADPKVGTVAGEWKRGEKGELRSSKANGARVAIAYKLPEQYDIRATFERRAGNGDAALILSHMGQPFAWTMGAEGNHSFAIVRVDGKSFSGNPAWLHAGSCLKNNQLYTTVVEVRKKRISAYLNGKLIVEWVPEMGELSGDPVWKLPDGQTLGIASWQSEVAFHTLELVEAK